jgi:ATP-dependent Clp protease ATP-binding subunit ClpC
MPKINVYLPDDLAAAVRAAEVPISAVCQKALAEAVRTVNKARQGIEALRNPQFDPDAHPQFAARLTDRMTARLRQALALAHDTSTATGHVETRHLLIGILDERDNLAVRLLQALDLDIEEIRDAAQQIKVDEPLPTAVAAAADNAHSDTAAPREGASLWSGLTLPARIAIGAALEASIELGHNYLGCEHLLLGLLSDADTGAGRVLQGTGIDSGGLRRAIVSAAAGFVQARLTTTATDAATLDTLIHRLDAIEQRLTAANL